MSARSGKADMALLSTESEKPQGGHTPSIRKPETVRIRNTQLPAAKVSNPNFGEKCGNSLDISKGISQSGIYRFESSQVSQAVTPIRDGPQLVAEKPANGGLLQFGWRSPHSQFGHVRTENAESLWPFIE
jgi:hypothetical protein